MQAFIWDCVRARTKLGIAIAARRPIMATTIMISTRVKPDLLDLLIFMLTNFAFLFSRREHATGGFNLITVSFTKLPVASAGRVIAVAMPRWGGWWWGTTIR